MSGNLFKKDPSRKPGFNTKSGTKGFVKAPQATPEAPTAAPVKKITTLHDFGYMNKYIEDPDVVNIKEVNKFLGKYGLRYPLLSNDRDRRQEKMEDVLDYMKQNKGRFGLWIMASHHDDDAGIVLDQMRNKKLLKKALRASQEKKEKFESIIIDPNVSPITKYLAGVSLENWRVNEVLTKVLDDCFIANEISRVASYGTRKGFKHIPDTKEARELRKKEDDRRLTEVFFPTVYSLAEQGKRVRMLDSLLTKAIDPLVSNDEVVKIAEGNISKIQDNIVRMEKLAAKYDAYSYEDISKAKLLLNKAVADLDVIKSYSNI